MSPPTVPAALPTVSVVIPTRDRPALLPRALAAVQAQTLAPLEVLVVDDGSTPPNVRGARVVRNTHARGASGARNAGAAAARGELLAFLDDDDEWLPDYLAAAVGHCAAASLDVVCTDLLYHYADGRERPGKTAPPTLDADAFLTRNPGLIGSNLLVRRAVYLAMGGFDESLAAAEDMDFGLRLGLQPGLRYAPLSVPLVRHHHHDGARLCTQRGEAMRAGVARFFALHGERMSAAQRARYRDVMVGLWGVDEHGRDAEPLPPASVIVAVRDGAATLRPCLDSLLRLDYPHDRLEVLCVDNGSTDATPHILAGYGAPLRVLHEAQRGPAAARNAGLRVARGEVVAFTDADCTVAPDWLRRLVEPLADPRVGAVGGRILSRPTRNPIERFGERIHDHARAIDEFVPPYVITMNWASRRAVLEEIGRFDARLLRGSDVECSLRLLQAGYALRYAPAAVVRHRNERTPWGLVHEGYTHAVNATPVSERYADLARRLRAELGARQRPPYAAAPHWSDRLWWALFHAGKRLGRAHAAWRARASAW